MKSNAANQLFGQIETAITEILVFEAASASQIELSYLAKFLVVFISGIYEETIETIVNEMVGQMNNPNLNRFIETELHNHFRNPDMSNVLALLGKFNNQWKSEIIKLPNDAREALDSICRDKNNIAHGGAVNITLRDVIDFYKKSKVIIEKIDDLLL